MSEEKFYDKCMVSDYNTSFEYFVDYYGETATVKAVIECGIYFLVLSESTPYYGDDTQIDLLVCSNDFADSIHRAFFVTRGILGEKSVDKVKDIFSTLCQMSCQISFLRRRSEKMYVYTADGSREELTLTSENLQLRMIEAFIKAGLQLNKRSIDDLCFGAFHKHCKELSILLSQDKGKLLADLATLIDSESEADK
ncbi:MAG: hypothetical protein E7485_06450 [Ruminococcaceae bacterium]|nr:hypothetical protein [Oscillospiraceae bacterium]